MDFSGQQIGKVKGTDGGEIDMVYKWYTVFISLHKFNCRASMEVSSSLMMYRKKGGYVHTSNTSMYILVYIGIVTSKQLFSI